MITWKPQSCMACGMNSLTLYSQLSHRIAVANVACYLSSRLAESAQSASASSSAVHHPFVVFDFDQEIRDET